jgi:hypothetical protein
MLPESSVLLLSYAYFGLPFQRCPEVAERILGKGELFNRLPTNQMLLNNPL